MEDEQDFLTLLGYSDDPSQGVIELQLYDDLDLITIDQQVQARLRSHSSENNPEIIAAKRRLAELQKGFKQRPIDRLNYTYFQICIRKQEAELRSLQECRKLRDYIKDTADLVESYRKIGPVRGKVVFGDSWKEPELDRDRIYLIELYLSRVQNYVPVEVKRLYKLPDICHSCGEPFQTPDTLHYEERDPNSRTGKNTKKDRIIDDSIATRHCVLCGAIRNATDKNRKKEENDAPRESNESTENISKALKRYQGLQDINLPEDLIQKLDSYFIDLEGMPSGEEIKKRSNVGRLKRGTNHKMLYAALEVLGLRELYQHANLVGSVYWGWELPNVQHLEVRFMTVYQLLQIAFKQIEGRCRISRLGTQYMLYKILRMLGHECSKEEFKIAENENSWNSHESMFEEMCLRASETDSRIYFTPN